MLSFLCIFNFHCLACDSHDDTSSAKRNICLITEDLSVSTCLTSVKLLCRGISCREDLIFLKKKRGSGKIRCVGNILKSLPAGPRGSRWEFLFFATWSWILVSYICSPFNILFNVFSSCFLILFLSQGRGESCFTALICPVAGLGIRQAGQQGPGQGVPVDPSSALGPTTARHLCPGMANTPVAANLQDSKVCTVVCRDNDSGWMLAGSCHELSNFSSPGREVPCAFSKLSCHGERNFCHRVNVVQVRQELAWPLAGHMRQQVPVICTASLERHSRIIAQGPAVWIQMVLSRF